MGRGVQSIQALHCSLAPNPPSPLAPHMPRERQTDSHASDRPNKPQPCGAMDDTDQGYDGGANDRRCRQGLSGTQGMKGRTRTKQQEC